MISCGSHSRDSLRNLCMAVPSFFERGWKEKSLFCFFQGIMYHKVNSKVFGFMDHLSQSRQEVDVFSKNIFHPEMISKKWNSWFMCCSISDNYRNMYLVQIHCVWKKKRIHCSDLSKFVDVILKIAFQRKFTCSLGTCRRRSAQNDSEFRQENCSQSLVLFSAVHRNRTPFLWFEQIAKHVLLEKGIVWIHRNLRSS